MPNSARRVREKRENDEFVKNTKNASGKYGVPNVSARNANAARAKDVDLLISGEVRARKANNAALMNS